ncbi:hypothetical protein GWG65_03695 [Bradyrhizobium sp. CSA207]|uniref:hypothetical protein n=1 Tax=Bradyrhizobium sp. CSA207 TaxID=2698826 RepID=UPI0023B1C690|nr:hypothetical protein [Bradyrhizobium sp. CSA207]MDE5440568.1 hypothetical protein [Bradyrhizobium sp. CSA207]
MASEAFALSPMSARAAEPNEQDYDAIREAFMETARGRWFLGEFARRNRNADTSMVLDAVAKIEETLAAQRQPIVEDRLPEALVQIRHAIREAETIAIGAFDPAAIEASAGPIQRGVRIIKEISWRWREIGADGRICDLIDSQLAAIETACTQVLSIDPRADLAAAFDLLKDRVAQTDADDSAAPQVAVPPSPAQEAPAMADVPPAETAPAAMASEAPAAFAEALQDIAAAPASEAAVEIAAPVEAMSFAEETMDASVASQVIAESHVAVDESFAAAEDEPAALAETAEELPFDAAAEAEDEAVLERIAMEMAAPDPDFDEIVEPVEIAAAMPEPIVAEVAAPVAAEIPEPPAPIAEEPQVAEAPIAMESLARLTDAIAAAAAEVMERPVPAMAQAATLPMPSPMPMSEQSLGATILASGMLQKPRTPANDPLAPLRRMTQAEKIAFFS